VSNKILFYPGLNPIIKAELFNGSQISGVLLKCTGGGIFAADPKCRIKNQTEFYNQNMILSGLIR
jgi:hypothetical protein